MITSHSISENIIAIEKKSSMAILFCILLLTSQKSCDIIHSQKAILSHKLDLV